MLLLLLLLPLSLADVPSTEPAASTESSTTPPASSLPDFCFEGNETAKPPTLPAGLGYLDFVDSRGQRTVLYYSGEASVVSEIRWRGLSVTQHLLDLSRNDSAVVTDWPAGPCSVSSADSTPAASAASAAVVNDSSPSLTRLLTGADFDDCRLRLQPSGDWRCCRSTGADTFQQVVATVSGDDFLVVSFANWTVGENVSAGVDTFAFLTGQRLARPLTIGMDDTAVPSAAANTPAAAKCGMKRETRGLRPRLPDSLYWQVSEQQWTGDNATGRKVYSLSLDYLNLLTMRVDNSESLTSVVEDFKASKKYSIVYESGSRRRNCSSAQLEADNFFANSDGGLKHGCQLMHFGSKDWLATGLASVDGILCTRHLLVKSGVKYIAYFANKATQLVAYVVLNGTQKSVMHFSRPLAPGHSGPDYDLSECFNGVKGWRIGLQLSAPYAQVRSLSQHMLESSVRHSLSSQSGVLPVRVSQAWLSAGRQPQSTCLLTTRLLDALPGDSISLAKALGRLKRAADGGKFKIDEFGVSGVSRLKDDDDDDDDDDDHRVEAGGHSGGAMAALAIFMLLLGGAAGVFGAWWKWKRRPGMPYYVQD